MAPTCFLPLVFSKVWENTKMDEHIVVFLSACHLFEHGSVKDDCPLAPPAPPLLPLRGQDERFIHRWTQKNISTLHSIPGADDLRPNLNFYRDFNEGVFASQEMVTPNLDKVNIHVKQLLYIYVVKNIDFIDFFLLADLIPFLIAACVKKHRVWEGLCTASCVQVVEK